MSANAAPARVVYTGGGVPRKPALSAAEAAAVRAIEAALTADHDLMIIQVLSEPDELGRVKMFSHWWGYRPGLDTYGHRAQVFVANLEARATEWAREHTVQIIPFGASA